MPEVIKHCHNILIIGCLKQHYTLDMLQFLGATGHTYNPICPHNPQLSLCEL